MVFRHWAFRLGVQDRPDRAGVACSGLMTDPSVINASDGSWCGADSSKAPQRRALRLIGVAFVTVVGLPRNRSRYGRCVYRWVSLLVGEPGSVTQLAPAIAEFTQLTRGRTLFFRYLSCIRSDPIHKIKEAFIRHIDATSRRAVASGVLDRHDVNG